MAPSSENLDLVTEAFRRLSSGDRASMLEMAHPEVEAYTRLSSVTGEPYCGAAGVRQWFRDIDEQFTSFEIEMSAIDELQDGRVLATGRVEVRGRESNLPWVEDVHYLVAVEDGKVRRMEMFLDRDEALKAAGVDV